MGCFSVQVFRVCSNMGSARWVDIYSACECLAEELWRDWCGIETKKSIVYRVDLWIEMWNEVG